VTSTAGEQAEEEQHAPQQIAALGLEAAAHDAADAGDAAVAQQEQQRREPDQGAAGERGPGRETFQ
jgi:hypothetical protein